MRYVELHCKSNFSFLRGASHPDELVLRAAALGYAGLALTDHESVAGVVRGLAPAKELGLQYIVGAEVHPADAPSLVLWPTDRAAYGRLCQLISRGRLRAEKGECELRWNDVEEFNEGLLVGVSLPRDNTAAEFRSGIRQNSGTPFPTDGSLATSATTGGGRVNLTSIAPLRTIRDTFGDRAYLLCELHRGVDDRERAQRLMHLSTQVDLPLVAAGDVYYHAPERMLMFDCLTAVRNGTTIDNIHDQRLANSQYHLRSLAELAEIYRDVPQAIERTVEIADRCRFQLDELRYEYPKEIAPPGMTLIEHLKRLTWEGAKQRWPDRGARCQLDASGEEESQAGSLRHSHSVPQKIVDLLKHEFDIIESLQYEAYFLTVWDLVRFARERGILCQGRGSAANSTVCYCLGITSVDPSLPGRAARA